MKKLRTKLIIGLVILTLASIIAFIAYKVNCTNKKTSQTSTNTQQHNIETNKTNESTATKKSEDQIKKENEFYNKMKGKFNELIKVPDNNIVNNSDVRFNLISDCAFTSDQAWICVCLENSLFDPISYKEDEKDYPNIKLINVLLWFNQLAQVLYKYSNIVEKVLPDTYKPIKDLKDHNVRIVVGNLLFVRIISNLSDIVEVWKTEIIRIYEQYINSQILHKLIFDYLDKMIDLVKNTYSNEPGNITVGDTQYKLKIIENNKKFRQLVYYMKYIIFFTIFAFKDDLEMLGILNIFKEIFGNCVKRLPISEQEKVVKGIKVECKKVMLKLNEKFIKETEL